MVTIDVDFDGTVSWNGEALTDRADAGKEACAQSRRLRRPARSAHRGRTSSSSTSHVAAMVLASAQRLGVTKLGMVGNEQFVK